MTLDNQKLQFFLYLLVAIHSHRFKSVTFTLYRLTYEQRAAIADYFRVYKVVIVYLVTTSGFVNA